MTVPIPVQRFVISIERNNGRAKLSLALIKFHAMKTYGGVEI
jgi:hypothetical protein